MMVRVALVSCAKKKQPTVAAAKDLYTSWRFRAMRRYAERNADVWYVLSAKHGLVHPDTVIEPYDVALASKSSWERREWARLVIGQLRDQLGDLSANEYEVHAGAAYRDFGLVERLSRARGTYLPVTTLGADVWDDAGVARNTVQRTVSTLRRRLDESGLGGVKIDGKEKGHYRLVISAG